MARWVIDTSVLIDHLRGDGRAEQLLVGASHAGHELWSVTVVRTEVLAGMRSGDEVETHRLLALLSWRDVDIDVADRAGELARRYLKSYPGVDTIDYMIAAATLVLGAELKTQNIKHFPMFRGLRRAYG